VAARSGRLCAVPRDIASNELPRLTHPDGRRVGLLLSGPPGIARWWRRGVTRLRSGRLPAMVAVYPDGRRFAVDAGDVMYEQVYRLGEYEPVVTKTVRRLLRPGDVAVDVGANHGWYSLVMAQAVGPAGAVHAIEPLPALTSALRRNIALNPSLKVQVHAVAAGAEDGTLELHVFDDLPHGHTSAARLGGTYRSQVVPCKRLDDLIPNQPTLVKVDVEGFEPEVLAGATGLLDGRPGPMWLIEVNHETAAAFGRRPDAALTPLAPYGYSVFRVEEDGIVPESDVKTAPHGATWLCVPEAHLDRLAD
jgi:FkbM family methyltransferase